MYNRIMIGRVEAFIALSRLYVFVSRRCYLTYKIE